MSQKNTDPCAIIAAVKIPFFPNTGDGTHCWQAVLKMALAVYEPTTDFSYAELDRISKKISGKWTWPTAAMIWLLERGYEVKLIEEFDYRAFADRGEKYILEKCGEEVGRAQIAHSDVAQELVFARRFADMAPLDVRLPTRADLVHLLREDFVVICNINAAALYGMPGYSGHFVVLVAIRGDEVGLHDPGLPARPNLRVPWKKFETAWAYPTEKEKNLLALRKPANKR